MCPHITTYSTICGPPTNGGRVYADGVHACTLFHHRWITHSERVAIGEAIEAELGNRKGVNQHTEHPENLPDALKGDTRDLAAKAAWGYGSNSPETLGRSVRDYPSSS